MSGTKPPSLFDPSTLCPVPSGACGEPVVWIRRVVVVASAQAGASVIRDVELRRGLNIIATTLPQPGDGPVGHNVGKTLFTRLIRYCLGESQFARGRVRDAIASQFGEAHVVAEIILNGQCWIIIRPIGEAGSQHSWCCQSEDWRSAFENSTSGLRHSDFVQMLHEATVARFAETHLPHQNRPVRWLDLLAWLSRDQFCRYRDPLEWRNAATESGTGELHGEDASILIRLVMDLLDDEERALIEKHKDLLSRRSASAADARQAEQDLSSLRRFLQSRLRITDELLSDDLFAKAASVTLDRRRSALKSRIQRIESDSGLSDAEKRVKAIEERIARLQATIDVRSADRQEKEGLIEQNRNASEDEFVSSFADLAHPCSLPPGECPLKPRDSRPGERNPYREALIEQQSADLQALDQELAGLRDEMKLAETELRSASAERDRIKMAAERDRRRLSAQLGRLQVVDREARGFLASTSELAQKTLNLAGLDRQLKDSREAQREARDQVARRQETLNLHFNAVLARLLGPSFQGRVAMSIKGLHLVIDDHDSAPGEAMATSGTVHSLDLACLRAAIGGLGWLPRLLIHDSPREGDLEPHLYGNLFELAAEMEGATSESEPAFQYIVTTTTPPPASTATDKYVRLRLDARTDDGLLLQQRF